MRWSVAIDKGRAAAMVLMWERLADIELICRNCSPTAYEKYAVQRMFSRLRAHQTDLLTARNFYFDLSTWTNVAWRYLGRCNVNELDDDRGWIAILERLQGAEIGLSLASSNKVYGGNLRIQRHSSLKVFGQALSLVANGEGDFVSENIEIWPDRIDGPGAVGLTLKSLPSVGGITVSRDTFLCEMVGAVGFDPVLSDDEIPDVTKKLAASLEIIGHDHENLEFVNEYVATIVPLENPNHDEHKSLSIEATPGSIYIGKNCKLEIFAEALVHEADHQRLYDIRRSEPLVKEDSKEKFCSPWRLDPRPAGGLLFGASAFFRVSKFWHRLLTLNYSAANREAVGYRSLFTAAQCLDALDTLLLSTELTDFGRNFCEVLRGEIQLFWCGFESNPQFEVWSKSASRSIRIHKQNWASKNGVSFGDAPDRQTPTQRQSNGSPGGRVS